MRPATLLMLIATLASAQDQTGNNTGSIKVTVVDSVTHQPVRKAMVRVTGIDGDSNATSSGVPRGVVGEQTPHTPQSQTTDASGTFAETNLQPGQYSLSVQHQNYPHTRFGGSRTISIKAGEQTATIIEMVPGATVSGRVLDEDSDPLDGCVVRAQSAKAPYQDAMAMGVGFRTLRSSEDGAYRLYGILPGKYILTAQCQTAVFRPRPLSAGPDPPPSAAYAPQFYPAASSVESAEVIELAPGAEKSGVDFQMRPAHVTHIHVVLAGGADWRGRNDLASRLVPTDQSSPPNMLSGWRQINTTNGEFEIPRVFPGSYLLLVTSNLRFDEEKATGELIGAAQQIDVGDKAINVMVNLRSAVDLNGTIEIEGPAGVNPLKPSDVTVQLVPESRGFQYYQPEPVNDDGSFTIKSAFPGPSRLQVNAPMAFLKSAWIGSAELTGGLLDLSSGAHGELRVVVSTNTASIHGTAPALAQVMMSPAGGSPSARLFLAQADQNGQFKIEGLAPGKYRLGFPDQLESLPTGGGTNGQEVTLQEGQTLVVELKPEAGAQR
jgi:protocatechuate 3,4-dioxygenase beta subunit